MSITQPITSLKELERDIAAAADEVAAAASAPLRADRKPGGGGDLWGPSHQRLTSPLQMLAQVADHAIKLREQMVSLTGAITGEAPPPARLRQLPTPNGGLLPAVANYAHEIEMTHVEITRLIEHLKGRL